MKPILSLVCALAASVLLAASLNANAGVYLAFDDGPSNSNSPNLVNALKSKGAKATFFCIGNKISANMTGFNAIKNAGYSIQNHSYTHSHMLTWTYSQVYNDIKQCQDAVKNAGGGTPRYFRPPYLEQNTNIKNACAALGLTIITDTVDSQDWNGATVSQIIANCNKLQNNGILLAHNWPANTVTAMPTVVQNLNNRGLSTSQY